MSDLHPCPQCGERLIATARHVDCSVRCPACRHDFVLRVTPTVAPASSRDDFDLPRGTARPSVPAPRASQSDGASSMVLGLAAASLIVWPLAPIALWLSRRTVRDLRAQESEVPSTVRMAFGLSIAGTVLLTLALVCLAPALFLL